LIKQKYEGERALYAFFPGRKLAGRGRFHKPSFMWLIPKKGGTRTQQDVRQA